MADGDGPLPPGAGSPLVGGSSQSLIVRAPGGRTGYLYSQKNVVATGLAVLVGLVLAVSGVVGLFWPLAMVGVYVAGAVLVPQRRGPALTPGVAQDVRHALAAQLRALAGKVPNDIYGRVTEIQASILALLPRVENLSAGSEDRFIVERTALEYLPAALESYLNLPREFATAHRVEGGKTPSEVLVDQLDLLETKLGEISEDIAGNDSDRLLANGRFLREKFSASELDPPPST